MGGALRAGYIGSHFSLGVDSLGAAQPEDFWKIQASLVPAPWGGGLAPPVGTSSPGRTYFELVRLESTLSGKESIKAE
jgi:hypothetical protein